jgi:hypothetical protein
MLNYNCTGNNLKIFTTRIVIKIIIIIILILKIKKLDNFNKFQNYVLKIELLHFSIAYNVTLDIDGHINFESAILCISA